MANEPTRWLVPPVTVTPASSLVGGVSITDYGAVGNGETDDTAAIQAACDASTFVYFPPCDVAYVVTDTITCVDNVLVGTGRCNNTTGLSKVVTWDSNDVMFQMNGNGCGMVNMILQGYGKTPYNGMGMTLAKFGNDSDWQADAIISGCWFTGGSVQLELSLAQGYNVSDCVFDASATDAVRLLGAPNLVFKGNRVCQPYRAGLRLDSAANYDMLIQGNVIDSCSGPATGNYPLYTGCDSNNSGIHVKHAVALNIDGNIIATNFRGVSLAPIVAGDVVRDVRVSNNTFAGHVAESVYVNSVNRATFIGNDFVPYTEDETSYELTTLAHLVVDSSTRVSVIGGSVVGNASRTVGVQFTATTASCYASGIVWEDIDAFTDLGGTGNIIGPFVPPSDAVDVTGDRSDGVALTNLLTALAGLGIITDSTTA